MQKAECSRLLSLSVSLFLCLSVVRHCNEALCAYFSQIKVILPRDKLPSLVILLLPERWISWFCWSLISTIWWLQLRWRIAFEFSHAMVNNFRADLMQQLSYLWNILLILISVKIIETSWENSWGHICILVYLLDHKILN